MTDCTVIRPAAFQRPHQAAVEEAPKRTAAQLALIGRAHVIVADALGMANMWRRQGHKEAARERLLTAARDLVRLGDLPEILALVETMYRTAREIRCPRGWRERPGSNVGLVERLR